VKKYCCNKCKSSEKSGDNKSELNELKAETTKLKGKGQRQLENKENPLASLTKIF